MTYWPALLETVFEVVPLEVSVTVTLAPGMAAPVESVTVPEMVPRNSCAATCLGCSAKSAASRKMPVRMGVPHAGREKRLLMGCGLRGRQEALPRRKSSLDIVTFLFQSGRGVARMGNAEEAARGCSVDVQYCGTTTFQYGKESAPST